MSDSLQPHESQHARPPCPSPTPGIHSDSRPSSQRCHPAISSSVVPFSSCPQSLPNQSLFQGVNSSHHYCWKSDAFLWLQISKYLTNPSPQSLVFFLSGRVVCSLAYCTCTHGFATAISNSSEKQNHLTLSFFSLSLSQLMYIQILKHI